LKAAFQAFVALPPVRKVTVVRHFKFFLFALSNQVAKEFQSLFTRKELKKLFKKFFFSLVKKAQTTTKTTTTLM
jgi:hypothetical protein